MTIYIALFKTAVLQRKNRNLRQFFSKIKITQHIYLFDFYLQVSTSRALTSNYILKSFFSLGKHFPV